MKRVAALGVAAAFLVCGPAIAQDSYEIKEKDLAPSKSGKQKKYIKVKDKETGEKVKIKRSGSDWKVKDTGEKFKIKESHSGYKVKGTGAKLRVKESKKGASAATGSGVTQEPLEPDPRFRPVSPPAETGAEAPPAAVE